MLRRRRQIAAALESTEGSAESLVAADAGILVYDPTLPIDVTSFERTPARSSMSPLQSIPGVRESSPTFRVELKGSGTATTAPSWGILLQACGMRELDVKTITGSLATAAMEHGTTVTQANSGATGVVYKDHAIAATTLTVAETSGTFTKTPADTISDDYGTGVFTPDDGTLGTPGIQYWPDSSAGEGDGTSLTMGGYEDGLRKLLIGTRGTFTLEGNVGEPLFLNFTFKGVVSAVADVALLAGVTFEEVTPPKFQAAAFSLDDGSAYSAVVASINMMMNNDLATRQDANATAGVTAVRIAGRKPSGSTDPEMVLVATHDFFNNWFGGTPYEIDFTVGSTAGNTIEVFSPRALTTAIGDADRNGIVTGALTFGLFAGNINSPADDELVIYHK